MTKTTTQDAKVGDSLIISVTRTSIYASSSDARRESKIYATVRVVRQDGSVIVSWGKTGHGRIGANGEALVGQVGQQRVRYEIDEVSRG